MTVGILTFYLTDNCGSTVMTYALRKIIQNITGDTVDVIPYSIVNEITNGFGEKELRDKYDKRIAEFNIFLQKYIGVTKENIPKLTVDNYPKYDAYLIGSDVVWDTVHTNNDSTYFLDFLENDNEVRKISYSPSVGQSDLTKLNRNIFEKWIDRFDYLGVREKNLEHYVQQFTNKKVRTVLDPSLLLQADDYRKIQADIEDKDYILLYLVFENNEMIQSVVDFTNRLARYYNCKVKHFIYNIPEYVYGSRGESFSFCSPTEFLALIDNARMVITNSFHGVAYSIVYRKPFYTWRREGAGEKTVLLLEDFNLSERILGEFWDIEKFDFSIDYTKSEKKIRERIEESKEFLVEALGKKDEK